MNWRRTNHKPTRLAGLAYAVGLLVCLALVGAPSLTGGVSQAAGLTAIAPGLGTAASFAVLGGQAVTNTGPSVVDGDLGVSPGTAITGFPPGIVNGVKHAADAVALQAQTDVTTAYNALAGQACTADLTGQDLGGKTLLPGVYCFTSSAQLTGQLTLDAQGNSAAVWIFKVASTLTTASNASVLVTNGGSACNVFWQIGSSATIGTGTTFVGNILALTSITLATGSNVVPGRALARNGSVTMDNNHVSRAACGATPPASISIQGTVTTANGQPVQPGTSIEAVTPSGAVCGSFVVTTAGIYGPLQCLIRDASTPNGVVGGDVISFRVGGQPATPTLTLPGTISAGDLFTVNLVTGAGPTNIPEPLTITLLGAGLVGLAGYVRRKRAAGHKE